jgi:hypothetical protein
MGSEVAEKGKNRFCARRLNLGGQRLDYQSQQADGGAARIVGNCSSCHRHDVDDHHDDRRSYGSTRFKPSRARLADHRS